MSDPEELESEAAYEMAIEGAAAAMSVDRYVITTRAYVDPRGKWVRYADHLAAVAEAEQRALGIPNVVSYEQGQRDAIAAAVARVEALPRFYDGAAYPDEVIAAIKATP